MTLEELPNVFFLDLLVSDAVTVSLLLVAEKEIGLIIFFSTLNFLLYGSLILITRCSQRALFPFIPKNSMYNIIKCNINIAQE